MHVLVGECTGKNVARLQELGWGRMWIARDRNIYTYPGEPWGLDNGAFRDWAEGKPFDGPLFMSVVEKAMAQPGPPILAVLPDAPGNAAQTLAMAYDWLPRLPPFPWYLALQDGMTEAMIEPLFPRLAGLFLGGTNRFKKEAPMWCELAHNRGLKFHYGRCGTLGKLKHAQAIGADSIDSAFPMWTQKRFDIFALAVCGTYPDKEQGTLWSDL
jgi:hypothetical protein